jgi:hypothetical protein
MTAMAREFSGASSSGSVSVDKATDRQSDGVIVEYALESTGETPMSVRLSDRLRVESVEDLGFHEDHEPSEWTVDGRELELRASLDPGAERSFVMGVIAAVGPEYEPAVPTVRVEEATGFFDRAASPLAEAAEEAADSTDGDSTSEDDDGGIVRRGGRSTDAVSTLVGELEAGSVPESELSTLRRHLGFDSLVEEIEAVRRRQEAIRDRVDDLAAEVEAREMALESIRAAHEADVEAVQRETRRRQEGLREDLEDVRRSLRADLGSLEAEVEALEDVRRRLLEGLSRSPGAGEEPGASTADEDPTPETRTGEDRAAGTDPEDLADGAVSSSQDPPISGEPKGGDEAEEAGGDESSADEAPSLDLEDD